MHDRTWQDNAREWGGLVKQGRDFRLAALVACSVKKGSGQGTSHRSVGSKCSLSEFAREALGLQGAKINTNRASRHLDAWDRMAAAGHVPAADTLTPGDVDSFGDISEEVQQAFADAFSSVTAETPSGGRPRASAAEIAQEIARQPRLREAIVNNLDDQARMDLRRAINQTVQREYSEASARATTPAQQKKLARDHAAWRSEHILSEARLGLSELIRDLLPDLPPSKLQEDTFIERVRAIREMAEYLEGATRGEAITNVDDAIAQWLGE